MAIGATGSVLDQINGAKDRMASSTDTFMKLLTTQLKNQDPLSPLDSNEFTAQIVQMTGVEQQLLTNDLLAMMVGMSDGGLAGAVDIIGKSVTAETDEAALEGGKATWNYDLSKNAANVKYEILNSAGQVVWSRTDPNVTKGDGKTLEWDGKASTGTQLADGGTYTLRVTATGAAGEKITTATHATGIATGVELINGQTMVSVGKLKVPLGNVTSVKNTTV